MSYSIEEFLKSNYIDVVESKPATCVDGRCCDELDYGISPQTLGGTIHFYVLKALKDSLSFTESSSLVDPILVENGFGLGGHNHDGDTCDCGFAANNKIILQRVVSESKEIQSRLLGLGVEIPDKNLKEIIRDFEALLEIQDPHYPTGDELVANIGQTDAKIYKLNGSHQEIAAMVNLVESKTFDTNKADENNSQAFNLDLWYVLKVAKVLGLDETYAKEVSLMLYVATEMVLVEDKGNQALPVYVVS